MTTNKREFASHAERRRFEAQQAAAVTSSLSAGALRAAKKVRPGFNPPALLACARIIDRESGLAEAREAIKGILSRTCQCNCASCGQRYEEAREAIAKIEGRNET